jgi:3-phenylpropionate/trans-cinnamate dioxygenase ferredoxin subunit
MTAEFVKVCNENDIAEGKTKAVMVGEQPVILARKNDKIYALEGVCTHDGGIFEADENLIDCQIECPRHGARFDIQTGDATRMPAVVGIATIEVKVEDGEVYVAVDQE